MNDRWRDEIVWKQNACLGRRSGVMDRDQVVYLFLSSLRLCSPAVMAAWVAFATTQKYRTLFLAGLLLCGCDSSPAHTFLQDRRSYHRMCKDEHTYLLEQKCPNTM